jgi:deoxyribodipyrimidine photo-lyase
MADAQIIWFRQDLRLADQAAVRAAASAGPVVAVYVLDDETPGEWRLGGAQRWWLHHSLTSLADNLGRQGVRLVLRRGRPEAVIPEIAAALQTRTVHALHHYEPFAKAQEAAVARCLDLRLYDGNLLLTPGAVVTGSGARFKIFTPFWKVAQAKLPPAPPLPIPELTAATLVAVCDALADWRLLPAKPNKSDAFDVWTPGEVGAQINLQQFAHVAHDYVTGRNIPGKALTSRLSPHLHFGEISPQTVWAAISAAAGDAAEPFLRELGWRDFAQTLLDSFPDSATTHQRTAFEKFAFTDVTTLDGSEALEAWRHGHTGYPIIDAGMRQLWATGWMHNRVRMLTASFLVKHLRIDWREGSRWFWQTLVDADLGSNTLGWQWSMGSGVDSQPFYRIMAPVTQSEKFDAQGDYIRRWVPELAGVPAAAIHAPWLHGGVRGYPGPIVDHAVARARALAAYAASRA